MPVRNIQFQLGIAACVISVFLILVAIPSWISSPSNVGNIVLSPLFWPYTIAGITGLIGLGLISDAFLPTPDNPVDEAPAENTPGAWGRLLGIAAIMVGTMLLLPLLGMVLTCMLCFAANAFLVKTRHPKTALICAIVIPLVLYAFFTNVAGVAIPQGELLRFP